MVLHRGSLLCHLGHEELSELVLHSSQAWSSAGPRGQWRTGKNGEKLVAKLFVVPQRPSRDR